MVLLLRFNQKNRTSTALSGDDESGNGNHFMLSAVSASQQLQARSFGLAGDGACYCSQFAASSNFVLDPNICDRQCDDGSAQSCGSTTTSQAVSVYTRGTIRIGGLAPNTEYEFTASFVTIDGDEFDISQPLVATTANPTVPGRVNFLSVVEHQGKYIELQWMAVEDDGGAQILKYQVFVNGYLEFETANGDTHSSALDSIDLLPNCTITVCAVNELGAGPQQMLLMLLPADKGIPVTPMPLVPMVVTGGLVTFSTENATSSATSSNSTATLVIQQRESSLRQFTNSFMRVNGDQVTVYKLRHDTAYVFRAYSINSVGSLSAFSAPVIVQTGTLDAPAKTPTPIVTHVTGGSITMLLTEPLDTGGLPVTAFNIFVLNGTKFAKLTSITAGVDSVQTTTTIYRDPSGAHLRSSTTYTFKALALQFGSVCEDLSTNEQESDEFSATTALASTPLPPSKPFLLTIDGCAVSIALTPLQDYNGATVSGGNIRLSTGAGVSRTLAADYGSSPISLKTLLPFTNYSVTVSVATDEGDTDFSEPLWFTTGAPNAPSKSPVFKLLDVRSSSLVLQWNAPESTGGGAIKGKLAHS